MRWTVAKEVETLGSAALQGCGVDDKCPSSLVLYLRRKSDLLGLMGIGHLPQLAF